MIFEFVGLINVFFSFFLRECVGVFILDSFVEVVILDICVLNVEGIILLFNVM